MTTEESIHVAFDETNSIRPRKDILDDITDTLEDTHIHEEVHKNKRRRKKSIQKQENYIVIGLRSQ